MSYDLTFVPKADDQTWEEALDAAEENEPDGPPSAETWSRLLTAAGRILGEVSVDEGPDFYELSHDPTGIQVWYGSEVAVTVPYWYSGERARDVLALVYRLGEVVQAETGLSGYDPQLDLALSDAVTELDHAVGTFDQVAASFAEVHDPGSGRR